MPFESGRGHTEGIHIIVQTEKMGISAVYFRLFLTLADDHAVASSVS